MPMIGTRNERDEAFGRSVASESDEDSYVDDLHGISHHGIFFTKSSLYSVRSGGVVHTAVHVRSTMHV